MSAVNYKVEYVETETSENVRQFDCAVIKTTRLFCRKDFECRVTLYNFPDPEPEDVYQGKLTLVTLSCDPDTFKAYARDQGMVNIRFMLFVLLGTHSLIGDRISVMCFDNALYRRIVEHESADDKSLEIFWENIIHNDDYDCTIIRPEYLYDFQYFEKQHGAQVTISIKALE